VPFHTIDDHPYLDPSKMTYRDSQNDLHAVRSKSSSESHFSMTCLEDDPTIYTQKHAAGTALVSAHSPVEVSISSNSTENEEKGSAHIM
jgi:hypothetical protein